MNIPAGLYYAKTDEWIKVDGKTGTIGITDFAQEQLSDVVYVEITVSEGDLVKKESTFGTVESVKAAADVNMPVSGKVISINEGLSDKPENVNEDPFGQAWMVKIELTNPDELKGLMDSAAYTRYCEERNA